jgi:diaminopimelate epimerase
MIIDFTKLSPGGNDTIIVQSAVPTTERAGIVRTLMSSPYVGGEQVGYLTLAPVSGIDARLDMMGGELCVNGLRSAATVVASQAAKTNLRLTSSGTDEVFEFVSIPKKGAWYTSITLNLAPRIKQLAERILIVHLDGISHLLCEFAPEAKIEPMNIFADLRQKYDKELATLPAFGIIPFQRRKDGYEIFPVVYVRETDTIIPETGCGSGSVALALSMTDGDGSCSVFQPSGCPYQVDVTHETGRTTVTLGSDVDVLVKGVAFIGAK